MHLNFEQHPMTLVARYFNSVAEYLSMWRIPSSFKALLEICYTIGQEISTGLKELGTLKLASYSLL
jgi:hypothetical protein